MLFFQRPGPRLLLRLRRRVLRRRIRPLVAKKHASSQHQQKVLTTHPAHLDSYCSACYRVLYYWARAESPDVPQQMHEFPYVELDPGCSLCQIISTITDEVPPFSGLKLFYSTMPESHSMMLRFTQEGDGIAPEDFYYMIYTTQARTPLPCLPEYERRVDLPRSHSFIEERLSQCLNKHDRCPKYVQLPMPKRLIDVESASPDVKLVELGNVRDYYATLSHCWGSLELQPLKTLRSNFQDMLGGVRLESLPVVFAQAVALARSLRVQYIWIDSLCIVQDDPDDWNEEGAKMGDYYSNSLLNIATSSSASHSIPFLDIERDRKWSPMTFSIETEGETLQVFAKRVPSFENSGDGGKLYTRAWAFQESTLAPRSIHFTYDNLVWDCLGNCEGQQYFPTNLFMNRAISNIRLCRALTLGKMRPTFFWRVMVEGFTRRDLTFRRDSLPAFGGVAQKYAQITKAKYVCGLWDDLLLPYLCWTVWASQGKGLLYVLPEYVAPSWSWASAVQAVQWSSVNWEESFHAAVKVVKESCTLAGRNEFGRVTAGHLILRGPLACCHLRLTASPQDYKCYNLSLGDGWYFRPDYILEPAGASVRRAMEGAEHTITPLPQDLGTVWCLLLGIQGELPENGLTDVTTDWKEFESDGATYDEAVESDEDLDFPKADRQWQEWSSQAGPDIWALVLGSSGKSYSRLGVAFSSFSMDKWTSLKEKARVRTITIE